MGHPSISHIIRLTMQQVPEIAGDLVRFSERKTFLGFQSELLGSRIRIEEPRFREVKFPNHLLSLIVLSTTEEEIEDTRLIRESSFKFPFSSNALLMLGIADCSGITHP